MEPTTPSLPTDNPITELVNALKAHKGLIMSAAGIAVIALSVAAGIHYYKKHNGNLFS